jgi:hypothetical protein
MAFLCCAWAAAAAAEWTRVGGNETIYTAYAEPESIRRSGSSARMRGLYDFMRPDLTPEGEPFRSTTVEREYDCEERRVRLLAHVDHAGAMGGGRAVSTGSRTGRWESVVSGALDEAFWKLACGAS